MADSLYQPIVSDNDTESETPPVSELSIPDPREFRRKPDDELDNLTVEEAAAGHRHQIDPVSAEDASERPLVHVKTRGHGPISVDQAADALKYGRGYQLGAELREAGLSEAQMDEVVRDVDKRGTDIEPLAPPPPEVKGIDEYGREDDGPINVEEGAKQLSEWRQRHQQEQQEALAELGAEAAQHAEAEAQAQQAQQPTAQPQPQQPDDPVQTERQQLAAERRQITHIRQMDGVEASWRLAYDQVCAEEAREFPGLPQATAADVEQLKIQDPARFQKLAQYEATKRDRAQKIAALTQQRGAREQQQAQINAQQRAAARAEQDAAFERLAAQHIEGWERNHAEVRAQAKKTLVNAGLSEAQIQHLWSGDHDGIDVHSSVLQLVLAKAAQWDLATQKAHQARQAPVPPVMRPGTYRAPSDGADSVRELQARLNRASGREALRIATALTKAKRGGD
jgi:hypothetical protein